MRNFLLSLFFSISVLWAAAQTITLTYPTGGQTIYKEQTINITWSSTGLTPSTNISIELLNSSNITVLVIADPTPNDGSHPWLVPASLTTGNYKIKVYRTGGGASSTSSTTFSIINPLITVIYPNGGENFYPGNIMSIEWTNTGTTSPVTIEITNASGGSPVAIIQSLANAGAYNWPIPTSQPPGSYKIKLYTPSNTAVADLSDNAFTITAPYINVNGPGVGNYFVGFGLPIDWTSGGVSGNVAIELQRQDLGIQKVIRTSIPVSPGTDYWTITSDIPNGTYRVKIYSLNNTQVVNYSSYFTIAACGSPNPVSFYVTSLTATTARLNWGPVSGTTAYHVNLVQSSQAYPGTPTYSNITTNYKDVTGLLPNTTYKFQVQSVCNSGSLSFWSGSIPVHFTTPQVGCAGCTQWTNPPAAGTELCTALSYLCQQGIIIQTQHGTVNATTPIQRQDLGIMLYKTLFGGGGAYSDGFPCTYLDMQDKTSPYYKAVLALSHLQYNDNATPFNRDEAFDPALPISRKYALKVFLEAWNIPPDNNEPSPYSDVTTTDEMYGYIKRAYSLGLATGSGGLFRPNDNILRDDAFLILYRMMQQATYPKPSFATNQGAGWYFIPHNLTPENMRQNYGESLGGFTAYSENVFAVKGYVPLEFSFQYDATKTGTEYRPYLFSSQITGAKYNFESMGKGWTHSYNSYLIKVNGPNAGSFTDDRIYIRYPDGHFASFKYTSAATFEPETKAVYESLSLSGSDYLLMFKNRLVLRYTYLPGNNGAALLSSVKDRFNNEISIQWELATNKPRIKTVTDPYGRKLDFGYYPGRDSLINLVTCTTGDIVRQAAFDYNLSAEDMSLYINPNSKTTIYTYFTDSYRKNLLKEIQLPSGAKQYCDYDLSRRFKRTSSRPMATETDFDMAVDLTPYYADGTPAYIVSQTKMKPTTGTTQMHITNTTYTYNNTAQNSTAPTHNVTILYADAANPALWTSYTDNLTGLVTTRSFDQTATLSRGNLLNSTVTRNGQSLISSWTYTPSYNDVDTYTDPGGVVTDYSYSLGFLTGITRGEQQIIFTPHALANGVVTSIEAAGVKTNLGYNQYFNQTSKSVQNTTITSTVIYDAASRPIQTTAANGRIDKVLLYDNMDNPIDGIQDFGASNITWHNTINVNNNLAANTTEGQTTTWGFDPVTDELITESLAGFTNHWGYHLNGKLQSYQNKNGYQFNLTYYPDDEAFGGAVQSDGYASYTYNTQSKSLETITKDGKAITILPGTDNLLRPTVCTYDGMTITHELNNYGSITKTILPNGWQLIYTRNANNQVEETRLNGVLLHTKNYDPSTGRQLNQVFGNGNTLFTKQFSYQPNTGRLSTLDYYTSAGIHRYYEHYTGIDNSGNHLTVDKMSIPLAPVIPAAGIHTLTPGADNRLINDNGTGITNNNNGVQTGGTITVNNVDPRDNILQAIINGFSFNAEVDGLENIRRFNTVKYVVDVLDNNKVLMETDMAGIPLWVNIWSGSEIVSRVNVQTGVKYFPVAEYNGSVRMWIDETGTITHQYNYLDAFGTVLNKQEAFSMPYQYHGVLGVQTLAPDLVKMGARYYLPSQRRFISADPIAASNGYVFAAHNPEMMADPGGEKQISLSVGPNFYYGIGGGIHLSLYVDNKLGDFGIQVSAQFGVGIGASIGSVSIQNSPKDYSRIAIDGGARETISFGILGFGINQNAKREVQGNRKEQFLSDFTPNEYVANAGIEANVSSQIVMQLSLRPPNLSTPRGTIVDFGFLGGPGSVLPFPKQPTQASFFTLPAIMKACNPKWIPYSQKFVCF